MSRRSWRAARSPHAIAPMHRNSNVSSISPVIYRIRGHVGHSTAINCWGHGLACHGHCGNVAGEITTSRRFIHRAIQPVYNRGHRSTRCLVGPVSRRVMCLTHIRTVVRSTCDLRLRVINLILTVQFIYCPQFFFVFVGPIYNLYIWVFRVRFWHFLHFRKVFIEGY